MGFDHGGIERQASPALRITVIWILVGVIGSYGFLVLPLLLSALGRSHSFSSLALSLVGVAVLLGMFLGSVLSTRLMRGRSHRSVVLVGGATLVLCHAGSGLAASHLLALIVLQLVGGAAGAVLMAAAFMAISQTRSAERYFAIFVTLQLTAAAAGSLILGKAINYYGSPGAFGALAGVAFFCLGGLGALTPAGVFSTSAARPFYAPGQGRLAPFKVLLGQFAFGCGIMGVWSIAAFIGRARGWNFEAIAQALSFSLLASCGGALFAAAIGGRWPRSVMIWVGGLIGIGGAALATGASAFPLFVLGTAAFAFAWNMTPPFQLAFAVDADPSGRLAVLSIAAVKLGYAVGAGFGVGIQGHGFQNNFALAAAGLVISCLAFTWPHRGSVRASALASESRAS